MSSVAARRKRHTLEGSLVAPTPAWCGGSRGPRMAHKAGDSLPVWLAKRSHLVTCCTGATATGARLLSLHRSFSHQAGNTTQPPSFRAATITACAAARAAMPNSEEESVYVVCLAALTAMLRARGLMFST